MKTSLCQLLLKKEKEFANQIYLRQPRDGFWIEVTWAEAMNKARKVAAFLLNTGLKKGSHVSIISKNCAEWFITDFGICLAGMVSVPLFTNQQEDSIHFVLEHGDVELVFVGKLDDHERVRSYIPKKYPTIGFDYHEDLKVTYPWSEVMAINALEEINEPGPEDLYTIIYSSGTSGSPKGAMFTHQAIANYLAIFPKDLLRIRELEQYRLISYLPLAHVYERSAIELASVSINSDVSFVESLDKFAENLRAIQPNFFTAVPRIWGVFQQKIEHKIPAAKLKFLLKIPVISYLIKRKIINGLGLGHCTNCFSGASHLPTPILDFFDKLGLTIQEGYGQTENLAYATLSMLGELKQGYVGTPRLKVKIKTTPEGELLLNSPCLMKGYYKDKESTKTVLSTDGWLHTGDLVELDSEERVKITGRISEIFKNQTGEFVAPTPIEKRFLANKLIDQLCLVGRELPTNVLIVTLNPTLEAKKNRAEIRKSIQNTLHKINSLLAKYEKISHVIVVKNTWTPEDMLTPTLKVRRKLVETHYADLIHKVMADRQSVVWE